MRSRSIFGMVALVAVAMMVGLVGTVFVGSADASWKAAGWQNHSADLWGPSNVTDAIDDLDARLDSIGVTATNTGVSVAGASDGLAAKTTITRLGAFAADDRFVFIAPVACTIRSIGIVGDTTVSAGSWTFAVSNMTDGQGLFSQVYTNSAGVANTYISLGALTNASAAANDVYEVRISSNATPTGVGESSFVFEYE
jgi:hypothetical protein